MEKELTNEVKMALINHEIAILKEQEYQCIIRGKAAGLIGNQAGVDANTKALENILKAKAVYADMLKEFDGPAGK